VPPKPSALKFARPLLVVATIGFIFLTAKELSQRWAEAPSVSLRWAILALAFVPLVLLTGLQGFAWRALLRRLGATNTQGPRVLLVYIESQLARYIPGKMGLPLVRLGAADELGATKTMVGVSILIEMLSWSCVGGLLGFGLALFTPVLERLLPLAGWASRLAFALSLAGLVVLAWLPHNRYPKRLRQRFGEPDGAALLPFATPVIHLGYFCCWSLHGLLLALAVGGTLDQGLEAAALLPIATVAGFLVLATPGGLGTREAILALGLTPSLGASSALTFSILSRAGSILAEFIVWLSLRARAGSRR
jgi:hypothetical protein